MNKAQVHRCSKNRTRLWRTQSHGRALGVPESTFCEQRSRRLSQARQRRADPSTARSRPASLLLAVPCGSPRVRAQLRPRRRSRLEEGRGGVDGPPGSARPRPQTQARPDQSERAGRGAARPAPNGISPPGRVNQKWVGDFKQIDTDEGCGVPRDRPGDLFSRRTGRLRPVRPPPHR